MAAEKRGVSANIITVGWSVSMVGYSLKRILNWGKWNINKTKINFRCPVSIFQIPLSSHTRVHILFDQSKWYPCNWRKRRRLNKSLIHCSSQNTSIFISFVLGRWRALLRFSLVCFLLTTRRLLLYITHFHPNEPLYPHSTVFFWELTKGRTITTSNVQCRLVKGRISLTLA